MARVASAPMPFCRGNGAPVSAALPRQVLSCTGHLQSPNESDRNDSNAALACHRGRSVATRLRAEDDGACAGMATDGKRLYLRRVCDRWVWQTAASTSGSGLPMVIREVEESVLRFIMASVV